MARQVPTGVKKRAAVRAPGRGGEQQGTAPTRRGGSSPGTGRAANVRPKGGPGGRASATGTPSKRPSAAGAPSRSAPSRSAPSQSAPSQSARRKTSGADKPEARKPEKKQAPSQRPERKEPEAKANDRHDGRERNSERRPATTHASGQSTKSPLTARISENGTGRAASGAPGAKQLGAKPHRDDDQGQHRDDDQGNVPAKRTIDKTSHTGENDSDGVGPVKSSHIIEEHIEVGVPAKVAYAQWTQYDHYGEMFKHESAKTEGRDKAIFTAKIGPSRRQWQTKIVEQAPGHRIAWRSTGGAQTMGVVTFHELDANLTQLMVEMEYHPSGLFEVVGNFLRMQRRRVRKDLKLFKHYVELHGEASGRGEPPVRPTSDLQKAVDGRTAEQDQGAPSSEEETTNSGGPKSRARHEGGTDK